MDITEQDTNAALLDRLLVLSSLVSDTCARVCTGYHLEPGEWHLLAALAGHGEMTSKNVGIYTHMDKAKVSRVARRLVGRQLIVRRGNPSDQRSVFLTLTPEGRRLYDECAPKMMECTRRIEEAIPPEDRNAFDRAVSRLFERARELSQLAARTTPKRDQHVGAELNGAA
jgi:DNA-binding MarR family transcriptional regulator